MIEGQWYSVTYEEFAACLGFPPEDLMRERLHLEQVTPIEEMVRLYPAGVGAALGKVSGLHPTYKYLERMFRETICCRIGDKSAIADYMMNLLMRCIPDARPFSVFDFIWG